MEYVARKLLMKSMDGTSLALCREILRLRGKHNLYLPAACQGAEQYAADYPSACFTCIGTGTCMAYQIWNLCDLC
jgi:hypothetical protein